MKDKIKEIIEKIEESEAPFYEAVKMLKELVEDKWTPKLYAPNWYIYSSGRVIMTHLSDDNRLYGNEFPTEELAIKARNMNKRNQLILQAKHEMGYGDGDWSIERTSWRTEPPNQWVLKGIFPIQNPELTFETKEQAETVLNMVKPYLEES